MSTDRKLFTVLYGSKLYGTSTPTSDRDVKHVVLPDIDSLLLGKQVKNKVKKTNKEKNTRNTQDDVDEEFIPIQIFAKDFMAGQTYALELAFSLPLTRTETNTVLDIQDDVEVAIRVPTYVKYTLPTMRYEAGVRHLDLWAEQQVFDLNFIQFVGELREKFLTSNIKAMMGYVVNQASLYSFKGERLNAIKQMIKAIEWLFESHLTRKTYQETTLGDMYNGHMVFHTFMNELAEDYPGYFKITEYDIGDGRMRPCFTLLEKTLPFTNTMQLTHTVVTGQLKKYGTRAEAASATNVDWKAMMHALRIVNEGIELLRTRKITLPLPQEQVDYLLSIKRGEVAIEKVKDELEDKLAKLKYLEAETRLPPSGPMMDERMEEWLVPWMHRFYGTKP